MATAPAELTANDVVAVELALMVTSSVAVWVILPTAVWLISLKEVNAKLPLVPVAPMATAPEELRANEDAPVELALIV